MAKAEPAGDRATSPDTTLRHVCVYCGSGPGRHPDFADWAAELGRILATEGLGLVYGGGDVGLMGILARAVLDAGGHVTGIIPDFLQRRENRLDIAQETIVVSDMHTRKRLMFERADAFVALPGGIGTLEELVEQLTWAQLGRHAKPILIADLGGFWTPLLRLLDHMRENGFIRAGLELDFATARRVDEIVPLLRAASARAPKPETSSFVEQNF